MINADVIRSFLDEELSRKDIFLVEISVMPGNRIVIYIDSMKGVNLDECKAVSRFVESKLDREVQDFELEVSSPGLDKPLKLAVQFEKNIGRILEVVKADGIKLSGKLLGISDGVIRLDTETIVKDSRKGKKKIVQSIQELKPEEIKTAKVVISLKK